MGRYDMISDKKTKMWKIKDGDYKKPRIIIRIMG